MSKSPKSVVEESLCSQGDKKSSWKRAGMSGMCSVCACSIPWGFHQELPALVHECEQSVAQVLAVLSGAEGGDVRPTTPTAVQKQIDQMLPLDLTPSGSFEQELIFGWGKKRGCFPLIV